MSTASIFRAREHPGHRLQDLHGRPSISQEPHLHGLFFGIDEYESPSYHNLSGAIQDVNNMVDYFHHDLGVPLEQLTIRRNSEATRSRIISDIQALSNNPLIKKQDPIVIYFSGHGCTPKRPQNWPVIQAIVAYDSNTPDLDGELIGVIPDYTINVLLGQLASRWGDNITVIFDCCHSGSGTRVELEGRAIRGVDTKDVPPLTDSDDSEILPAGSAVLSGRVQRGLGTHVLLAACAPDQKAGDTKEGGEFTIALIEVLRKLGASNLTYKRCIQELRLPRNLNRQDPQCEGCHINRRFFDASTSAFNRAFIGIAPKQDHYMLDAGAAHGITVGSTFQIYCSNIFELDANPTLGIARVTDVQYKTSYLQSINLQPGASNLQTSTSDVPNVPLPRYALQIGVGSEEVLQVHFTEAISKRFENNVSWREAFNSTEGSVHTFVHSEKDTAQMIVDIKDESKVTFQTGNEMANKLGLSCLSYAVPAVITEVLPVLRAAAKWAWHADRTSSTRAQVEIQLLQVQEEANTANFKVLGSSQNQDGIVRLTYKEGNYFAFKLINKTKVPLYPYLFYFDADDLSIGEYCPPVVQKEADQVATLLGESEMEIGYGADGWNPIVFTGKLKTEVAIVRLFVSTKYLDLDSLEQESPFTKEHRYIESVKVELADAWDVITMGLAVHRP
ncbi:hypothetical protein BDV93DRAFT_576869 [Ceratobasidium sp. AG-I]|nr:hypothetical protein BDV93DRAFT_576869 [Ceratobasidium sp. AG-I]